MILLCPVQTPVAISGDIMPRIYTTQRADGSVMLADSGFHVKRVCGGISRLSVNIYVVTQLLISFPFRSASEISSSSSTSPYSGVSVHVDHTDRQRKIVSASRNLFKVWARLMALLICVVHVTRSATLVTMPLLPDPDKKFVLRDKLSRSGRIHVSSSDSNNFDWRS